MSAPIIPSLPVGQKRGIAWDEPTISEHDLLRGTRTKITEPKTPYRPMLTSGQQQPIGPFTSASSADPVTSSKRVNRAKDFGMATDGIGGILAVNDPRVMSALAKHNALLNSGGGGGVGGPSSPSSSSSFSSSSALQSSDVTTSDILLPRKQDDFEMKRKAHYGNVKDLLAKAKKATEEDDDEEDEEEEEDDDDDEEEAQKNPGEAEEDS